MVTRSHTQLQKHKITEDLITCDSNEPNLKNFYEPCLDTMIKIQFHVATKV